MKALAIVAGICFLTGFLAGHILCITILLEEAS